MDDIRAALYPVFAAHGIMVYPKLIEKTSELQVASEPMTMAQQDPETRMISPAGREIRDGKIPNTRHWATVTYSVGFVFVGDGSGIEVIVLGSAYDTNSDKAFGKATTAAIKRAFTETFDIIDAKEIDPDEEGHLDDNRAATTDRRTGGDRGNQAREAAQTGQASGSTRRSGPAARTAPAQPSDAAVASADAATGEVPDDRPEPEAAPAESNLDAQKGRIRAAVKVLGYSQADVDALATEVTGKKTRPEWINLVTAVKKLADALEAKVAEAK